MVFEKSYHYPSAAAWRGSNHGSVTNNPLFCFERLKGKWEIVKTVVYQAEDRLPHVMWVDKWGKYVWVEAPSFFTEFPIVGELIKVDAPFRCERIDGEDVVETGEPIVEQEGDSNEKKN